MFSPKHLISWVTNPQEYIWIKATLIKETRKAILIMFDSKKAWFPKAWILRIRRSKNKNTIKIKISQYLWTKKFG